MSGWYYRNASDSEQRLGPVSSEQLKSMISGGALAVDCLVWRKGMNEWVSVGTVAQRNGIKVAASASAAQTAVAVAEPTPVAAPPPLPEASAPPVPPAALGYFQRDMPPRAINTLKVFAPPLGDVGHWPLDDAALEQLAETARIRKRINAAAQMFLVFGLISIAMMFLLLLTSAVAPRGGAVPGIIAAMFMMIVGTLYLAMWHFTKRNHRWPSLVFSILLALSAAASLMGFFVNRRDPVPAFAGAAVSLMFSALFAYVAIRAYSAVPRFRAQPAWCQEIMALTKV